MKRDEYIIWQRRMEANSLLGYLSQLPDGHNISTSPPTSLNNLNNVQVQLGWLS